MHIRSILHLKWNLRSTLHMKFWVLNLFLGCHLYFSIWVQGLYVFIMGLETLRILACTSHIGSYKFGERSYWFIWTWKHAKFVERTSTLNNTRLVWPNSHLLWLLDVKFEEIEVYYDFIQVYIYQIHLYLDLIQVCLDLIHKFVLA